MVETRIAVCCQCRERLWVETDASAFHCLSCKTVNTLSNVQQSTRAFYIKDNSISKKPSSHHHIQTKTEGLGSSISPSPSSPTTSHKTRPPQKRALLCGVSYKKQETYRLPGAINDVRIMNNLLMSNFKFPQDCIRILTDEEQDNSALIPTRKNIEQGLRWLVDGCISGDSLVFYYAGHGSRERDTNRDELDGYDETLCPVDFNTEGEILDDYINSTIVRPLQQGVVLHAIIDACHSGTMLDLRHVYKVKRKRWKDNRPRSGAYKGTSSGIAISISACRDDQVAVDTFESSGKSKFGVLTYSLAKVLNSNHGLTYGSLLNSVQEGIDEACKSSIQNQWKKPQNLPQEVQLSSSEVFDIYGRSFYLYDNSFSHE